MICWIAAISIDCSFCPPTNSFNPNPVLEEPKELVEYDYTSEDEEDDDTEESSCSEE